jgi:hypothetical protein
MVLGKIKAARRSQPVLDLLEKLDAMFLSGFSSGRKRSSLYSVRGRLVILHEHSHGGYDVFVPIVDSNRVDETLQALEAYAKGDR